MIGSVVRRRTAVVGACAAALALLAGCGGGGGGAASAPGGGLAGLAPVAVARQAPDVTREAGSARFDLEMTYSSLGGPLGDMTMTSSGSGIYDFANQIGEAEASMSGGGLPDDHQEMIFRNNVLYQRPVGAGRWEKWDFSQLVNTPVGQYDPSQQLDLLRGVSEDVREIGTTELRGEQVRQYAITIDPQKLAQNSGVVVDGGLVQTALSSVGSMPGEVLVDEDGRVRRLQVQITVSGADIAGSLPSEIAGDPQFQEMLRQRSTESRIAIEYYDFGVDVPTQEPDPSTVDPAGPIVPGGR